MNKKFKDIIILSALIIIGVSIIIGAICVYNGNGPQFFGALGLIAIIVIMIILGIKSILEEKRLQREEEAKIIAEEARVRAEEARVRAEEERKRKTKCIICHKCSMGKEICDECSRRSDIILKETPTKSLSTYEKCKNVYDETLENIILSTTNEDEIYYKTKLLCISRCIQGRYYVEKIDETKKIISLPKTEIESKVKKTNENTESKSRKYTPNFESGKIYECNDGDKVRSKSERDIDNFFFENRIWHIYEYSYEHPFTKELAKPDFYLPDYNLYIEYFGLNTKEYLEKREHKIKMYNSDTSIKFEYLTYEDDVDITKKLLQICKKHNIIK